MSRWSRFVLAWAFVVLVTCVLASPASISAADQPTLGQSSIARWAMSAVGLQQGECFPWMRRVVQAATGLTIGNDYRLGYLQAGAVEVSPQAARNGDIIQIAKDADTTPFADYPGLHTALVLENQGSGKFKVVDSNSNFDGVVRVRDGYDPGAAAARYPGLTFHVYRLPETAHSVSAPPVPNSTGNTAGVIPLGSAAEIAADGDCLRVRTIAGLSGGIVGCLPTGTRVTVVQAGPDVDGYHWVTIATGSISGWASERYLRAVSSTPTPAPIAAAAAPVVPKAGRILSGVIPQQGIGLIVFGGGTDAELLAASGCPSETAAFWSFQNGQFVQLLPGVPIPIVNAEWRNKFPAGIPADTPLMGRCRPLVAATTPPAPSVPPTAAPSPYPAPNLPSAAAQPPSVYVVVEGDSLSSIAERLHGPTVSIGAFLDALYEANGITSESILTIGQVLRIPG